MSCQTSLCVDPTEALLPALTPSALLLEQQIPPGSHGTCRPASSKEANRQGGISQPSMRGTCESRTTALFSWFAPALRRNAKHANMLHSVALTPCRFLMAKVRFE